MLRTMLICSALALATLALTTLFAPIDWIEAQMSRERALAVTVLGDHPEADVQAAANRAFGALFEDTGLRSALEQLVVPTPEARARSIGLEDLGSSLFTWAETRQQVLWDVVYQSLYRLMLLRSVLTEALLLFCAFLVDGLMLRKVKQHSFGYASPVRFNSAVHALTIMASGVPVYLLLPVAITPAIIATWMLVAGFSALLLTANLQKRI